MTKKLLAAALVAVSTVLLSVGFAQADSNWPEREKGYGFIASHSPEAIPGFMSHR